MRFQGTGGKLAEIQFDGSLLHIQNGTGGDIDKIALKGNVGVGTASPASRFHIHSTSSGSSATGLLLTRDGDAPYMRFRGAGGKLAEIQFDGSLLHIQDGTGGDIDNIALKGNVGCWHSQSGFKISYPQYKYRLISNRFAFNPRWWRPLYAFSGSRG